jgi:hypothetical protein
VWTPRLICICGGGEGSGIAAPRGTQVIKSLSQCQSGLDTKLGLLNFGVSEGFDLLFSNFI